MSTQPSTSRFLVVLTFDIPTGQAALNEVIKTIQESKLPHLVSPIHLATDVVADRVLAEFGGVNDDDDSSTALQKDKG